jgi:hypothetical protein
MFLVQVLFWWSLVHLGGPKCFSSKFCLNGQMFLVFLCLGGSKFILMVFSGFLCDLMVLCSC